MEDKKSIEVVSGDGSNLDISPAYDHLNVEAPKTNNEKPKNIVIPKVTTKKTENKKEDEKKDDNDKKNNKEEKKKEN